MYPPTELPPWTNTTITFGPEDAADIMLPHHDALLISAFILNMEVRRVFIDGGSSADILFASTLEEMGIPRSCLQPPGVPLLGFGGKSVIAIGRLELPVQFKNDAQVPQKTLCLMWSTCHTHTMQSSDAFPSTSLGQFRTTPSYASRSQQQQV